MGMSNSLAALGLAGATALASPVMAQDALAPSSAWVVDAQADDCVLMRTYGTVAGKKDVQLLIRPQATTDSLDLTVSMLNAAKPPRKSALTTVLTPGGDVPVPGAFQGQIEGGGALYFRYNPEAAARFRKAVAIEIRDAGQRVVALKVPGVDKALAGARSCMDGLIKLWGYDPATIAGLSRRPRPIGNSSEWAGLDAYPMAAMRAGETVSVELRIDVDAEGRATRCVLWRGDRRVNERDVCARMVRLGRFEPALDADGKAVPVFWIGRLVWNTP